MSDIAGRWVELLLDLEDCGDGLLQGFGRANVEMFTRQLCRRLGLVPYGFHAWDDRDPKNTWPVPDDPRLQGISAVQFLSTSNITVHAMDQTKKVYINVFSCGPFDDNLAVDVSLEYFGGRVADRVTAVRT